MKSHLTKLLEKLKNKKVAFRGIARTNIPVIKLLLDYKNSYNIEILALDSIKTKEDNFIKYLINKEVECRLGNDYLKKLDMDIIFRSPGIYYSSEDLKKAKVPADALSMSISDLRDELDGIVQFVGNDFSGLDSFQFLQDRREMIP